MRNVGDHLSRPIDAHTRTSMDTRIYVWKPDVGFPKFLFWPLMATDARHFGRYPNHKTLYTPLIMNGCPYPWQYRYGRSAEVDELSTCCRDRRDAELLRCVTPVQFADTTLNNL